MSLIFVRYLVDNNALAKLTRTQRGSSFVRENCRIPTEVLYEARSFPDLDVLRTLEHPTTAAVLEQVRRVMASVPPSDHKLVDLYHVRGNADPILIAVALDSMNKTKDMLLEDEWRIVTDDVGVQRKAAEFGVATLPTVEFVALIAEPAPRSPS